MNWLIPVVLIAIAFWCGYSIGFDLGENYAIERIHRILKRHLFKAELEAIEIEMLNAKARVEEWTTPSDSHPDQSES